MPNRDGKGPEGKGSKTGMQMGNCEDAEPQDSYEKRKRFGRSFKRGCRKGRFGRGFRKLMEKNNSKDNPEED